VIKKDWQDIYLAMNRFICSNEEIIIEPGRMHIPEHARTEFYCYFDTFRDAFIREEFPIILRKSEAISCAYIQAENEVANMLELSEVTMMPGLHRFLHKPIDYLRRCLYDSSVDLLKGRTQISSFKDESGYNLTSAFAQMYSLGYAKWIEISLVKLLGSDELLRVYLPEVTLYEAHKSGGVVKEKLPNPEQSERIDFGFAPDAMANIADWVVHSTLTEKYVSARSQFGEPFGTVINASESREWLPATSVIPLDESLIIINQGSYASEIPLFSDVKYVCRPDIVVACYPLSDKFNQEGLKKAKSCRQSLKPVLGTILVQEEGVESFDLQEVDEDIRILEVGLDQGKLYPIVHSFVNGRVN